MTWIKNLKDSVMKIRNPVFLLLFTASLSAWAQPHKGCVAIFHESTPISIEVDLPEFKGGTLQTTQFQFTNKPTNLQPDESGRYCYHMSDPRFAFVHTFYYAVKEIEDYNRIFGKLGIPLKKTLSWHVLKNATHPSTGTATGGVTYPETAPDPSLIQHEIGHWVQAVANQECENCNSDSLSEGSANLLAALHSGDSIIGRHDGYAFAYDINLFVRLPDYIITYRNTLERIIEDPITERKYPAEIKQIRDMFELAKTNPDMEAWMRSENPYTTSDAINQPLWFAAINFGAESIKLIYVKTLSMLNKKQEYTYSEVAQITLQNANEVNPAIASYLTNEYIKRGVLTSTMKAHSKWHRGYQFDFTHRPT